MLSQKPNPFESGARKVIPAVLVYARSEERVLLIHRVASGAAARYFHAGKWNGLGGKLELDESPMQAAKREFFEEAGVEVSEGRFSALGTLQFPNFKSQKGEDWWVTVF